MGLAEPHVLIVNHYAIPPGDVGGTRSHAMAKALVAGGCRVTILASDYVHATRKRRSRTSLLVDGVEYQWLPTPEYSGNSLARILGMILFAKRAQRWISSRRFDVIIGSSPHLFAAYGAWRAAKRHSTPFVLEVRDLWPESLVAVAGLSARHPLVILLDRMARQLYRNCDHLVAVLPGAVPRLVELGCPHHRISVLPNAVDMDLAPPPEMRKPNNPLLVTYAGSIGKANAVESLTAAAEIASHKAPGQFRFEFIGDGPDRERLAALVAHRGMDNIQFTGPIPRSEVIPRLQGADILWGTTPALDLYAHGISPNKVYDYLAAGRPIVFGVDASNNPIRDAGAGLCVPPEDAQALAEALSKLLEVGPLEREELGRCGRKFSEESCSWTVQGPLLLKVIHKVCARPR